MLVPVEFDIRTLPLTIVIGKNPKQTTAFTAIKLLLSKKIPGATAVRASVPNPPACLNIRFFVALQVCKRLSTTGQRVH